MAFKRMDNVGIVFDDLGGTIDFFRELGLELDGRVMTEREGRRNRFSYRVNRNPEMRVSVGKLRRVKRSLGKVQLTLIDMHL